MWRRLIECDVASEVRGDDSVRGGGGGRSVLLGIRLFQSIVINNNHTLRLGGADIFGTHYTVGQGAVLSGGTIL